MVSFCRQGVGRESSADHNIGYRAKTDSASDKLQSLQWQRTYCIIRYQDTVWHKRVCSFAFLEHYNPVHNSGGAVDIAEMSARLHICFTGAFPECLGNIGTLVQLILSENNITGPLPPSFGENLPNMTQFKASSNPIGGKVFLSF